MFGPKGGPHKRELMGFYPKLKLRKASTIHWIAVKRILLYIKGTVDYHCVCEKVVHKELNVRDINSVDQIADIFTKGLTSTSLRGSNGDHD